MAFRSHALDGAMLYFDRVSGVNVRVENLATAQARRAAPRVVMFGVTNACNLRCDFCSRRQGVNLSGDVQARAVVRTNEPAAVIADLDHAAADLDLRASFTLTEVHPLACAVARVCADV